VPSDPYEKAAARGLALSRELEELRKARRSVMRRLGLRDGEGLRDALILQWLIRLYARRVGEARVLKVVREIVGVEG